MDGLEAFVHELAISENNFVAFASLFNEIAELILSPLVLFI